MHTEAEATELWCPKRHFHTDTGLTPPACMCIASKCAMWRWEWVKSSRVPFSPVVDAVLSELMGPDNSTNWGWSRQKSKSGERIISSSVEDWQRKFKPGWFEFVSSRGRDEAEKVIASRLHERGLVCEVRVGRASRSQYPFSISIQETSASSHSGYCGLAGRPS